jgi:hypothetical protein
MLAVSVCTHCFAHCSVIRCTSQSTTFPAGSRYCDFSPFRLTCAPYARSELRPASVSPRCAKMGEREIASRRLRSRAELSKAWG